MNDTVLRRCILEHFTAEQIERLADNDIPLYGPDGIRRFLASISFKYFILLYFSKEIYLDIPEIHQAFIVDCQDIIDRAKNKRQGVKIARAIPRGLAKTTYFARFLPLHGLLFQWSSLTLLIGNNQTAGERLLSNIKATIETNEAIIDDFPGIKGDTWGQEKLQSIDGSTIVAFGMGSGSIRGVSTLSRPSLIICDDLDDDASVKSNVQLDANKEFFDKALLAAGDNIAHTTSFVVVGTLIRKTSLLQYVLHSADFNKVIEQGVKRFADNTALWEEWRTHFISLALDDRQPKEPIDDTFYQEHKDELLKGTEVLWNRPDAYYYMMVYKVARGERAFNSEIQNTPNDSASNLGIMPIVPYPSDLKDYHLLASYDPAIKPSDRNAWVEVLFHWQTKRIIVSFVDSRQCGYADAVQKIGTRVSQNTQRYQAIYVESNTAGSIIADLLKEKLPQSYEITRINNHIPKNQRIELIAEYISLGQLYFVDTISPEMREEFDYYPVGRFDDTLDALATILLYLRNKGLLQIVSLER